MMDAVLDLGAFVLSLFFLSYSAYSDLKTREVSDRVWVTYLPLAISILFLRLVLAPDLLIMSIASVFVALCVSFLVFYMGLFGGADAKALICLSIALPSYPSFCKPLLTVLNPLFPLAILYNSYLFSLSTVVYVVVKNLAWKYKTRRGFFENYEAVPLLTKIATFLTGYKTRFKVLKDRVYLYPMEEILRNNGGFLRRLKLFTPADIERNDLVRDLEGFLMNDEEVWVTPGIPLLVFVLIGLVSTTLIGDVLIWIVIQGVSMAIR
jgi:preflagellin peptidase FlaK